MACFDGPVYLTQSAPDAAYAGRIVLYDVVHPDVVSRSGVLSSIVEAGGDVKLPDTVNLSEFKAWCIATTSNKEDLKSLELGRMCTMLKVCFTQPC